MFFEGEKRKDRKEGVNGEDEFLGGEEKRKEKRMRNDLETVVVSTRVEEKFQRRRRIKRKRGEAV